MNSTYRAIFESSGNATVIINPDTTIKYANQYFCHLVGLDKSEVEGKLKWTQFVCAKDRKRMLKYHHKRRLSSHGVPTSYEFCLSNITSQPIHCFTTITMIPDTQMSIASIMDITDRINSEALLKQSRAQFQAAFNHAPVATLLVNHQCKIERANRVALKTFQLAEPMASQSTMDTLIKRGYLPSEIKLICRPHHNHKLDEIRFTTKSGQEIYLKIIAVRINPSQQLQQWILMLEDITGAVKAKQLLATLPNRILQAHEDEKLLISREIHDTISQSLAALKMAVQFGTPLPQLLRQMDQLIEASRTLSQNLRPETIDNIGLIPALTQLAKSIQQRFNTSINITTNSSNFGLDSGKALQIYRIAQEAMLNAARHGQAQKIEVITTLHENLFRMIIKDNGTGFDQLQVSKTTKKSDSLGLKIMLERAKHIGADFTVHSKIGVGTKINLACQINPIIKEEPL